MAMKIQSSLLTLCSAIAALAVAKLAPAAAITIQPGDPQLPGVVSSVWRSVGGKVVLDIKLPVPSNMTSSELAATTLQNLLSIPGVDPASVTHSGDLVNVNSTPLFDPLDGVFPGGSIQW